MDTILLIAILVALCVIAYRLAKTHKLLSDWKDDWSWVNWDESSNLKTKSVVEAEKFRRKHNLPEYKDMREALDAALAKKRS